MGNLFESLKDYFEHTPKDVLDNDWKEVEYLNDIGPDVIEQVSKTLKAARKPKDTPVVNSIYLEHSLNNQLDDMIVLEKELLKKYS